MESKDPEKKEESINIAIHLTTYQEDVLCKSGKHVVRKYEMNLTILQNSLHVLKFEKAEPV